MVTFWDMNGPVLKHCQEKGETVNSVRYSTMLEEKLKPAVGSHHRGLLSKGVLPLHDNARPHTIQKLKFESISHPPYSPDLTPSDYCVFGTLKEALQGRRFHSNDEMKEMVLFWLQKQPKSLFFYWNTESYRNI
jgi:histone-lysine N-methyltransferase SETMAR